MTHEWTDEPELDPGEDVPRISASQIKKYRNCPKQYWFSYKTDKEGTKASKGYLDLGSAVHIAIEEILGDNKPAKYRNKLTHDLKKRYRQTEEAQELKKLDESMFQDGLDYLEVAARYIDSRDVDIVGIEEEMAYSLARDDVNARVTGIMDVATENEIWDWKTGTIRDDTGVDETIQGAIYMRGYEKEHGEPPDAVRFVYLKEEKERKVEPNDETWDSMLKYARSLMKGIRNEDYEASPGDLCYFCGYEGYCDASPVGAGDIEYEKF